MITEMYLDEQQVAEMLRISRRTLQAWRLRGGGPPYVKIGSRMVRYRETEVLQWLTTSAQPRAQLCPVK
ncbi:helix-turn-helix transcriptional regulator [Nitrospira sp. Kam-Ns4a]